MNPDGSIDEKKLDPVAQQAYQYAIEFYEKDHLLTRDQRSILAKTYSTVSYATLGLGWGTFFAVTSIPFYRQKIRTGSTKGTNVGIAMLFGIGAMMLTSPYFAIKTYNWQLEKLRQKDNACYEVASMLKPGETTKWMLYYQLTMDSPEHIMKDPRSKAAAELRTKTLYSGRDPMGLYSGPRAEMSKRRRELELEKRQQQQQGVAPPAQPSEPAETQDETYEFKSVTPTDDDPFAEPAQEGKKWSSAWDRVREENGTQSSQSASSWDRLRSQSTIPNIGSSSPSASTPEGNSASQSDFDKLLDQERHQSDELENSKW
ncbi:Rci37p [Cyberlindnera jadinii NRRL Y-1542]|uniref:DUF1689-domain-containing protein n=1 Tax=Cyberlindnera jadinii (strain ATCC 18201 / CBS 1600 / BCRC 20928 / JCM 3617 / NBRC 0987 / NRRL Y-1542) TaxID=983966 RepID=A0A1E4RXD7_CYBJN|nr:DUF1689-domain-containing protein [Cyberlindnera jadinii NRRL Y-1542]ODV71906.1 DUF1689-domain-containing protein [Cyberlindnera jadinii NRRL Y-1542]